MSGAVVAGTCLCGAVRFHVRLPSAFCVHCHCSMCRRSHGAGYVTWFAVPKEAMTLDGGAEHMARFASSAHAVRSFCERCGSSLFAESTHRADQIDVVLAAMEGPIDHAPQAHVFYDSGAEWVRIGDDLPTLGGPTGVEPIARAR